MDFIIRQSKKFYKCSIISFITVLFVFLDIPPCQAGREIKVADLTRWEQNSLESVDKFAQLINDSRPKTSCEAGREAYPKAAKVLKRIAKKKSIKGKPLKKRFKRLLREHFKNIDFNKITIYWGMPDFPKWADAGYDIKPEHFNAKAQTYEYEGGKRKYNIYVTSAEPADDWNLLPLLIHQIIRIQQLEEKGTEFGCEYFSQYEDAKGIFEKHPMEERAAKKIKRVVAEIIKKDRSLSEKIKEWGQAGKEHYPKAAEAIKADVAKDVAKGLIKGLSFKKGIRHLNKKIQHTLSSEFKDLIKHVTIYWDVPLRKTWGDISLKDTKAQTYGYNIYIKASRKRFDTLDSLALLIHQMQYVQQFHVLKKYLAKKKGLAKNQALPEKEVLAAFGHLYFKGYKKAAEVYENNVLEEKARERVDKLLKSVVSIHNTTDESVSYKLRWTETLSWNFWPTETLRPDEKKHYWIKGARRPQIKFTHDNRTDSLKVDPFLGSVPSEFKHGKQYLIKGKKPKLKLVEKK